MSTYTALLERADPTPLSPIAMATIPIEFRSTEGSHARFAGAPAPIRGARGARSAKEAANIRKPEAVVALYKHDEGGHRSMSQPMGTEHNVYTTDEYMKTSDTIEAEAAKGGALSRYERVGSSVATMRPERSVAHSPSTTEGARRSELEVDRGMLLLRLSALLSLFSRPPSARPVAVLPRSVSMGRPSGCWPSVVLMPSRGMIAWRGGTRSTQKTKQTINGNRKACAGSSGRSYSTPPTTGPIIQPMPDTVPMDAITVPSLSEKRSVARMIEAFSAIEPSSPDMK
mmetsp:Transcript_21071/g.64358  ORF Transcript_21071/g.64358 Transcript_21071/m.64358 type:complete len:285 (-) Transcript_21071:469-1323(-)|eukprot:scaffold102680_cov33-Tisochrysis_lutea.AAC.2